jgi:hypothetical protein
MFVDMPALAFRPNCFPIMSCFRRTGQFVNGLFPQSHYSFDGADDEHDDDDDDDDWTAMAMERGLALSSIGMESRAGTTGGAFVVVTEIPRANNARHMERANVLHMPPLILECRSALAGTAQCFDRFMPLFRRVGRSAVSVCPRLFCLQCRRNQTTRNIYPLIEAAVKESFVSGHNMLDLLLLLLLLLQLLWTDRGFLLLVSN